MDEKKATASSNATPVQPGSPAPTPKPVSPWKARLLGCGGLLLIGLIVLAVFGGNISNIARFGFGAEIEKISAKLESERFLTQEQYDELKKDVEDLRRFVEFNTMSNDNVMRYRKVMDALKPAFEDGRVDNNEFENIRAAVRDAKITFQRPAPAGAAEKKDVKGK